MTTTWVEWMDTNIKKLNLALSPQVPVIQALLVLGAVKPWRQEKNGERGMGRSCFMGTGLQFCKMEKIMETGCGDGCTQFCECI